MAKFKIVTTGPGGTDHSLEMEALSALGIAFERFILRRFYTADPILSLLVTFGLGAVALVPAAMLAAPPPIKVTSFMAFTPL
mgnify:CR=1 FL=1